MESMKIKLIFITVLALFCQLLLGSGACPIPECAATSNCETIDYLNRQQQQTNISVSFEPRQIINPAFSTSTLNGFNLFDITKADDFNTNHIIELEPVGNSTESCLLDNQAGQQCQYKLVTSRASDVPALHCGWEYHCDYQKNRIPQYIWRAECTATSQENIQSIPVYYKIPILELSEESNLGKCNPFERSDSGVWKWKQLEVPVACTCTPA